MNSAKIGDSAKHDRLMRSDLLKFPPAVVESQPEAHDHAGNYLAMGEQQLRGYINLDAFEAKSLKENLLGEANAKLKTTQRHVSLPIEEGKLRFPLFAPYDITSPNAKLIDFKLYDVAAKTEEANDRFTYTTNICWRLFHDDNSERGIREILSYQTDKSHKLISITFRGTTYSREDVLRITSEVDKHRVNAPKNPSQDGNAGKPNGEPKDSKSNADLQVVESWIKGLEGKSVQFVQLPGTSDSLPLSPLNRGEQKAKTGEIPVSKLEKVFINVGCDQVAEALGLSPNEKAKLQALLAASIPKKEGADKSPDTASYLAFTLTWSTEDGKTVEEKIYRRIDEKGAPYGITIARGNVLTDVQLSEITKAAQSSTKQSAFGWALGKAMEGSPELWAKTIFESLDRNWYELWTQNEDKALQAVELAIKSNQWQKTKDAFRAKYPEVDGGDINRWIGSRLRIIPSETGKYVGLLWGEDVGTHFYKIWNTAQGHYFSHTINRNLMQTIKDAAGWDEASKSCAHPERLQKIVMLWSHVHRFQESDKNRDFYGMVEANLANDDDKEEPGAGENITYYQKATAILHLCGADRESLMVKNMAGSWEWREDKRGALIKEPK